MNYLPLIIAHIGYKIIIDKTSDTAIEFYRNELDDISVNYLILQIPPTMLTLTSPSTSVLEAPLLVPNTQQRVGGGDYFLVVNQGQLQQSEACPSEAILVIYYL